jgi:hypothetical protein
MKKQAQKAIKKVAAKKKTKAPAIEVRPYEVFFFNTLLRFKAKVKIGHPPKIGEVLFVKKAPYTEKLRGVVVNLNPLSCLLDPTEDKKGNIIL